MNEYILSLIHSFLGITILYLGGEFFVQGSIALSVILGIPQVVIGLTVVALGTSSPELLVSLNSMLKNSDSLAASNVIGSNIFNVLIVLGICALIRPLKVDSRIVKRDVPILIATSCGIWGMTSTGVLTWQGGTFLIIVLIINTIWEINTGTKKSLEEQEIETNINEYSSKSSSKFPILLNLILGILLLIIGSNLLVSGAKTFASLMGVSETIIGLTIVAAGTSLPELVTSIIAALKGKTGLAIGNVIGSNLLNQLLIMSSCALISGREGLYIEPNLINKDIPLMVLTTFACLPIFWSGGKITRLEGASLVSIYLIFIYTKINSFISI
tara:strand:- start:95 stop:1078 length:984 start_codon:yes stop_codon:yes gene_type:complete